MTVSDDDIQRQWCKIRRLGLAQMNDGGCIFTVMSPSNTKVPNIDLFVSKKMSKQETYQHLTEIYEKVKSCPITGKQITSAPHLNEIAGIKKLVS
jgi:hypothetical protein